MSEAVRLQVEQETERPETVRPDQAAREPVIAGGARTATGRLLGSLSGFSGTDLGGIVIRAALERAGVAGDQVDYVIMGQVLQAGAGQIPARQAAVAGGIPMTVPALTINKVCLSGLDAIALAAQLIRAGEFDVVVAGGMESMSQAPHLLPGARRGFKYGSAELIDSMAYDGLTDAFDHQSMGASTEVHNARLGITRREQDEFSARSHQLAARAAKDGLFAEEIVGVPVPQRRGDPVIFDTDEGVRAETTAESLGALRPAFAPDGTITAGSASQISDGACAVVVMSARAAQAAGAPVLAQIGAHGVVAGPDNSLHSQPSRAIEKALSRSGLTVADLDLIEINEAFAAVVIQSMRDLGVDTDRVNVNGGAVAIGHPIGASGARIALHLIQELRRRGGGLGAAGLCGGGGQGDALLLRVPAPTGA
jgi:acetyl-CoA C-acetyltransferase